MVGSHLRERAFSVFYVFLGSLAALCLSGCDGRMRSASALERADSGVGRFFLGVGVVPAPGPTNPPADDPPPPPPPPPPPLPAPASDFQVESAQVVVITPTLAKVTWTTAYYCDSQVDWGKTVDLEGTPVLQPEPVLNHSVLLKGVTPGQAHYCRASSRTENGQRAYSEQLQFQTPAVDGYSVRPTHPRILFNEDDLPRLKQRIAGSHATEWANLLSGCEGALAKTSATMAAADSNYKYARALAFAGLLGGDSRFRTKAIEIVLECARLGASGGDSIDLRWRLVAMASVYDWLHSYISDSARSTLKSAMMSLSSTLASMCNDKEYVWGMSHGYQRPMLLAALALYGDVPEAAADLDRIVSDYRDGYLATWRNYGDQGGTVKGWAYCTWTLDMEVDVLASLKSGTSLDWFQNEAWFEKLVDWQAIGLRGDGTFSRSGDSNVFEGVSSRDWIYALSVVHHYRSPRAKWFADKASELNGQWSILNVYDILWDDPSIVPEKPSISPCQLFRTPGQVVLRSSWDQDAVVATFRSAMDYTLGHTHRDNNSFTIFYKGGLAIDAGYYDTFSSSHNRNYYSRTVAHNSILVYDPAEKYVVRGQEYVNDGGQRWLVSGVDIPSAPPPHVKYVLDPQYGYQAGGVVVFEDTDEFTYTLGDAAPSYSRSKLRVFDRHFLWLKSVAGAAHPVVAVLDQVESPSDSLKKTYLLHTQNRPEVQGTLVTAANKGGVLYQQTLLPRSPRIELVGGSGKEYWVGGQNYPPSEALSALDEAGSYRVEVSPSVPAMADRFLHVLHATDAGSPALPATLVDTPTMTGVKVGDWIVLFGVRRRGTANVSYAFDEETVKHLLVGMVPNVTYDVLLNGEKKAQVFASARGTVRFDSQGSGQIEVVPASTESVASSGSPVDVSGDMAAHPEA